MAKTGSSVPGSLPRDANRIAIQSGQSFITNDATGTPLTSPLSYTTPAMTIVVPDGAIEMILMPTTDLKVSEESNLASYDLILANSKESLPVASMQNVYIQRSASDGTLYFRFVTI